MPNWKPPFQTIAAGAGFAVTLAVWWWFFQHQLGELASSLLAVGGVVAVVPVSWAGRRVLDAVPTLQRASWVTTSVHFVLMILAGAAIIEATKLGSSSPGWTIPLPRELGLALMLAAAPVLFLTVVNLALHGLGAPFSIALSRRVATDWLYAWTRNPMVLSGIVFLVGLGISMQSTLYILWAAGLVLPAMTVFLRIYEERELEIRLGQSYLEYRERTPFLWPRRPAGQ